MTVSKKFIVTYILSVFKRIKALFNIKEEKIVYFNPVDLTDLYSSNIINVRVYTYFNNIILYTNALETFYNRLVKDQTIALIEVNLELRRKYVLNFFIHQGLYLDPVVTSSNFLNSCVKLINKINELSKDNELSINNNRNIKLLSNIINNLYQIFEVLDAKQHQTLQRSIVNRKRE